MLQIKNINLSFNKKKIFDDLSFNISENEKIGLIGLNGSGKTTFLKSISDPKILDSGAVSIEKNKKIAYLPQEVVLNSNLTVLDETFSTFSEISKLENELKEIEKNLEKNFTDSILDRYSFLQEKLTDLSPEILKAKTKMILSGLGFSEEQLEAQIDSLSVGWKMRIVLAKLLLQEADFYLFDEPTNHLDIFAKEWFLDFLKKSDFGFIIISHEKYFLDELCEKILELENGKGKFYKGNYSEFLIKKESDLQILESSFLQQKKELEQKKKTIERFRAGTKSKMAKSMEKALDKIEIIEMPKTQKLMSFSFPPVQESGKSVLKVSNLSQSFDEKEIFKNISFEIEKKEKIALVAANGVGKTTLFNTIIGKIKPKSGTVQFGYNVNYSIFAQDQNKELNFYESIIDNIRSSCPNVLDQKIRSFLGNFLFSGDDVFKKVSVLSGGEKNKVGMVSVLLKNTNFLLLDEPTNHLDIPSKEVLLKALKEFNGTILFICHDKDFINELATGIIELTPSAANLYKGNYNDFIYQKSFFDKDKNQKLKDDSKKNQIDKNKTLKYNDSKTKEEKLKILENQIKKIEKDLEKINEIFANFEYDSKEFKEGLKKYDFLKKELKEKEESWLNLKN